MTADQVKGTVTWKSFMSWRAGPDIYQILPLVLESSKRDFESPAVAYSADLSKYSNSFAKKKNKKIFLASKSEAHIQWVLDKLTPLNSLITSFTERAVPWNFNCLYCLTLYSLWKNSTVLGKKLFVLQAFLQKKILY
jgi:hypothetical protein